MKTLVHINLIFLILMSLSVTAHGQKVNPWDMPSTPEELYQNYEATHPKQFFQHLQRAALFYYKAGKEHAFEQWNQGFGESQWVSHDGLWFLMSFSCKRDMVITQPVLKKLLYKKGVLSSFMDGTGKRIGDIACNQLRKTPKGTIVFMKKYFWSGVKGTTRQFWTMVKIPGTDIYLGQFYPTQKYTKKELLGEIDGWYLKDYNTLWDMYEKNK